MFYGKLLRNKRNSHGPTKMRCFQSRYTEYNIYASMLWSLHDRTELKKATPVGHNTGGGTISNCQKIKFYCSAIIHTVYLNMLTGESGSAHVHVARQNTK